MSRVEQAVRAFMEAEEWPVDDTEVEGVLMSAVAGTVGAWPFAAILVEDRDIARFFSVYPDLVPDEHRAVVHEFITRANWDLPVGNFELDLGDGEVRFRTSADLSDATDIDGLVRTLILGNAVVMDHYFPGLEAAATGASADEAIAMVEGG